MIEFATDVPEIDMSMDQTSDLPDDWDDEILEELLPNYENLTVTSRDWTIGTIVDQVQKGNIDVNPRYQRRNVWNDTKRSRLIESIILGIPVPEVILAEIRKGVYAVIDGKQRLLSLTGFVRPESKYWTRPKLRLTSKDSVLKELNGLSYAELTKDIALHAQFENATIRCTFISNYQKEDVLYDIFHRLNSSSVTLNMQELRQAINRGGFSNFLMEKTNDLVPMHRIMGLTQPDNRLRDTELLLRFITLFMFSKDYNGNLRVFLDDQLRLLNKQWADMEQPVNTLLNDINIVSELLIELMGSEKFVGRRYSDGKFDSRFNRVLFEVELFFFMQLLKHRTHSRIIEQRDQFLLKLDALCKNSEFTATISDTTKGVRQYRTRFALFKKAVDSVYETNLTTLSFGDDRATHG